VGDEAIDVIVRAYERVSDERPIRDLRWTIMHLFHPSDAALKKMASSVSWRPCRIIPSVGPQPAPLVGRRSYGYAIPIRKTIDAGVLVGGGWTGGTSRSVSCRCGG
jgi:predicted amidohydrolase YtcJ